MGEFVIRVRENGPLIIQCPVQVVDHTGNAFQIPIDKPAVALCRCGHSATKPFCDGSHKRVGFVAAETAPPAAQSEPPATIG